MTSGTLSKNQRISKARQETIQRHKSMTCKTYELKFDKSHLSKDMLDALHLLFLEAKWFYNSVVASLQSANHCEFDYRTTEVLAKNRDGVFETRRIKFLSSQMRQEIVDRARDSLMSLVQLKRNGRRVGALKFKSRIESIPLKQYGCTYRIRGGGRVAIQNFKRPFRIMGLDQIPLGAEFANATLEQRNGDYFMHITTYQRPVECAASKKAIGVDAGIRNQLTLSNGLQIIEVVPVTRKIRRLHRELSRRIPRSKNWFKTKIKLGKEYDCQTNRRADARHKIVSRLASTYDSVAVQDDNVAGWQRLWGRRVNSSGIGGITRDLKTKPRTPVIVSRFEQSTRKCSSCGSLKNVDLDERIYKCDKCGLYIDRDLNSAINNLKAVPAERRELTPVDTKAATELMGYFNGIPNVSASLVVEAGSRLLATEANGP
jgi:putative transposase